MISGTLGIVGAAIADYLMVRYAWSTQITGFSLVMAIVGAITPVVVAYGLSRIWIASTR